MLFLSLLQLTFHQIKCPALIQVRMINTSRIANYQCELYCIFRNPTPRNKPLLIDWLIDCRLTSTLEHCLSKYLWFKIIVLYFVLVQVFKHHPKQCCPKSWHWQQKWNPVLIIFASQGLRSALLIFTLGIVRRIFEVTRGRFICNAASGSCNQSERALLKAHVL